jgi:hypothetical protein
MNSPCESCRNMSETVDSLEYQVEQLKDQERELMRVIKKKQQSLDYARKLGEKVKPLQHKVKVGTNIANHWRKKAERLERHDWGDCEAFSCSPSKEMSKEMYYLAIPLGKEDTTVEK